MQTLITPNEYENGVKKNPMFVQMQNPFSNYEEREISLNCKKHGLVKATVYVNRLNGEEMGCVCPLCEKEKEEEEQRRAKEREMQLEKERREEFYKSCNIKQAENLLFLVQTARESQCLRILRLKIWADLGIRCFNFR